MTPENTIVIGKGDAGDVLIDVAALMRSRLIIQASSGAGKTHTIKRVVEQLHGKVQQIIIDIEGDFVSLREGFDFVVVGKGGSVPAEVRSAALLARKLVELGVSTILDLSELDSQSRKKFVKAFFDALIALPKKEWPSEAGRSVAVTVDEAHVLCPERGQAESAESVIDLACRGRKRGFCVILATQRISKLRKDAVAECMNKMVGYTGYRDDRKNAAEELGLTGKSEILELSKLSPGEFYGMGPAISRDVVRMKVGEVRTGKRKEGGDKKAKIPVPTPKMLEIIAKLADIPKEAEAEAKTVSALQSEIRALKAHKCPQTAPPQQTEERVQREVNAALSKERGVWDRVLNDFLGGMRVISKEANSLLAAIEEEKAKNVNGKLNSVPKAITLTQDNIGPIFKAAKEKLEESPEITELKITGGARRMLEVLVSRYPIVLTRAQLGTLSRMKPTSGSFSTYLSLLKSSALIHEGDKGLSATNVGIDYLGGELPAPLTPEQTRDMWRSNLTGGAQRMFDAVVRCYPNALTRESLGELIGMTSSSGSFSTYLSMLRSNGLIEGKDEIKASETLFI